MITINQLDKHIDNTVEGQYLLTKITEHVAKNGNFYKQLTLEDATGSFTVYVWPKSGMLDKLPRLLPANVRVILDIKMLNQHLCGCLVSIYTLAPHEIKNAACLLPLSSCPYPARKSLESLVRFINHLPNTPLKSFVNNVFIDPEIAQSFLTTKGSMMHHHKERGGLLIHSVEVLKLAFSLAQSCGLDEAEINIIAVAGLLHDIGKIRTVGAASVRPVHYNLVSHEAQNLMMLSPYIDELVLRSPGQAAALKYIFNYLLTPRQTRGIAKFIGADIVVQADALSAALVNKRRLPDLLQHYLPQQQQPLTLDLY